MTGMICLQRKLDPIGGRERWTEQYFRLEEVLAVRFLGMGENDVEADVTVCNGGETTSVHLCGEAARDLRALLRAGPKANLAA